MHGSIRRVAVAVASVVAAAIATPAMASPAGDVTHGGCFARTAPDAVATDVQRVGVIGDASTTVDATGLPTDATVTCWIDVNGVEAAGTRFSYSGAGLQSGIDDITVRASIVDPLTVCEAVVYRDGSTESGACDTVDGPVVPPGLLDQCDDLGCCGQAVCFANVDDLVCPEFARVAGSYGPVTVGPDGDVYVSDPLGVLGGTPIYDCPPYGNY